jgi:hypothetical protein
MTKRIEDPASSLSEWNSGWRFWTLCAAVGVLTVVTGVLVHLAAETIEAVLNAI